MVGFDDVEVKEAANVIGQHNLEYFIFISAVNDGEIIKAKNNIKVKFRS